MGKLFEITDFITVNRNLDKKKMICEINNGMIKLKENPFRLTIYFIKIL